jgi:hypothetical protein
MAYKTGFNVLTVLRCNSCAVYYIFVCTLLFKAATDGYCQKWAEECFAAGKKNRIAIQ